MAKRKHTTLRELISEDELLQDTGFEVEEKQIEEYANICFNPSRAEYFKTLRKFYYQGDEFINSLIKRQFGEIQQIASLIFTPEKIILEGKFSFPEEVLDIEKKLLDSLVREVENNFYTVHGLDNVISQCIEASLVMGTCPIKVYFYGHKIGSKWVYQGIKYQKILPENLGVLYESLPIDDRQQVIAHRTFVSPQRIKRLYGIDIEEIREKAKQKETSSYKILPISPDAPSLSLGIMEFIYYRIRLHTA